MNSVEQVDLGVERTDIIDSSAVNTLAVIEEPAADNILLNLVETFLNLDFHFGINLVKLFVNLFINGSESLIADSLVIRIESEADILNGEILDCLIHFGVGIV